MKKKFIFLSKRALLGVCLFLLFLISGCGSSAGPDDRLPWSEAGQTLEEKLPRNLCIDNVMGAEVTISAKDGYKGPCIVTAEGEDGLVAAKTAMFTEDTDSLTVELDMPQTSDIYTVRAIAPGFLAAPPGAAESVTSVMFSPVGSDSRVSGLFVAPKLASEATEEQWADSLADMKELGIDTVILQYCMQTDSRYGLQAYFPYDGKDTYHDSDRYPARREQTGYILSAADALGMKVYVGLQTADHDWFDSDMYRDEDWLRKQYELSLALAGSLWEEFGGRYGNAMAGWYLPFEFESSREYRHYYGTITDNYYAPLTGALKEDSRFGDMDIMISPLMYSGDDKEDWQRGLKRVLGGSMIDIIAPQDGIGYGTQTHETVGEWFAATREAVDEVNSERETPVSLWINCENYSRLRNPDEEDKAERLKPMATGKFITSLDLAAPYADKLVSFSIHRWDVRMEDDSAVEINRPYYEAYKRFAATGKKPTGIAEGYYAALSGTGSGKAVVKDGRVSGLTDGPAKDKDNKDEYTAVRTETVEPFTIEIRFDDPVTVSSISSGYYSDSGSGIGLPSSVKYELLERSGNSDEIFTYTFLEEEFFPQQERNRQSSAELSAPAEVDGVRLTITPSEEWTLIDDVWVE